MWAGSAIASTRSRSGPIAAPSWSASAAGGSIGSMRGSSSSWSWPASGLRTFRLAEPLQMHFDEVYHARTAMEFLQDWRYGQSHDIYEWTHPHLAKYAMAAGIALWGEDDVSAVSDLGVPVRAAAMEPRREGLDGERAGERVHVATATPSGPTTSGRGPSSARSRRRAPPPWPSTRPRTCS